MKEKVVFDESALAGGEELGLIGAFEVVADLVGEGRVGA